MFESRLKWFTIAMALIALIIVVRLIDIQVVHADYYESLADRMLTRPVRYLPAPRGSILDRNGRVLVSDEPTYNVDIHYALLSVIAPDALDQPLDPKQLQPGTLEYLRAVARQLRSAGEFPEDELTNDIVAELLDEIDLMWLRISEVTGVPRERIYAEATAAKSRVDRIRRIVLSHSDTIRAIAEEQQLHPVVDHIDAQAAVALRLELEQRPWVRVVPASERVAHDVDSLVHVLGRMGGASNHRIDADPYADDELRSLQPGEQCGISGVERTAELTLRGQRGFILEDYDRSVAQAREPVRGDDVRLSIDLDLQRATLDILSRAVDASDNPCGGAAVVIDVATREVLALVSYPVYSYDNYGAEYDRLRDDTRWLPLRSRAVANIYPPGSTCKVIAMYGALADGIVGPDTHITCNGYFLDSDRNHFRCWYYNQYGAMHGPQSPVDAIRNSCNIYFYTVGDKLGPDRLCEWFGKFGLGRTQGTGLIEESPGVDPTADWIARYRPDMPRYQPADVWNFAIGQGEVSATPLQCANVGATIASGVWKPVVLIEDAAGNPLPVSDDSDLTPAPFDSAPLVPIRKGMWEVVNGNGSAKVAKLDDPYYVLCGKTGSAQAVPRRLTNRWTLEWPDGHREEVIENINVTSTEVLEPYSEPKPHIVGRHTQDRFPPIGVDGKLPSHAWFMGYTQTRTTPPGQPPRGKVYAISVILEYAGSGGHDASPVAKTIVEYLLSSQKEWGSAAFSHSPLAIRHSSLQ